MVGFTDDRPTDAYTCAAGKVLPFYRYDITADGSWMKQYRAAYRDGQQCALKPAWVPGAKCKQLTKTIYHAAYYRAWQRQQTRQGYQYRRLRQSTVEPVFGHLLHHYGLRRINVRGLAWAHKTMLLTAVAYNLKKLLKHRPTHQIGAVVALPRPLFATNRRLRQRHQRPSAPTPTTWLRLFGKETT
jgi:hypothetical protein